MWHSAERGRIELGNLRDGLALRCRDGSFRRGLCSLACRRRLWWLVTARGRCGVARGLPRVPRNILRNILTSPEGRWGRACQESRVGGRCRVGQGDGQGEKVVADRAGTVVAWALWCELVWLLGRSALAFTFCSRVSAWSAQRATGQVGAEPNRLCARRLGRRAAAGRGDASAPGRQQSADWRSGRAERAGSVRTSLLVKRLERRQLGVRHRSVLEGHVRVLAVGSVRGL